MHGRAVEAVSTTLRWSSPMGMMMTGVICVLVALGVPLRQWPSERVIGGAADERN